MYKIISQGKCYHTKKIYTSSEEIPCDICFIDTQGMWVYIKGEYIVEAYK